MGTSMQTEAAKTILRSGVMTVENNKQRPLLLGGSLVLVAVALLSFPQLFFEPLTLLYRITDQALLVIGLLGSVLRSKPLRFAGWTGICLFFMYAVFGSLPSVDHPAFDSNGVQRPENWIWRPALALAFYVALVVYFRKLAVKRQLR
jgi:hypothetical protein